MQQISPMLQNKIENQQKTNYQNNTQNKYTPSTNTTEKTDTFEASNKQDKQKKIAKYAAIGFIAASIIGGIIYAFKKGKAPNVKTNPLPPQETPTQENNVVDKIIKKFTDNNGVEIENIKLEKGKAIVDDGSMFTGVMETTTKSGKKVSINYEDGLMKKSSIDGELFKTYHHDQVNNGVEIRKFNNNSEDRTKLFFDEKGKTRRIVKESDLKGYDWIARDYENGKLCAKSYLHCEYLKKAEIYDEKGNIIKTIQGQPQNRFSYREATPDGGYKETVLSSSGNSFLRQNLKDYLKDPKLEEVNIYDKNNKITKSFIDKSDGTAYTIEYNDKDDSYFFRIPKGKIMEKENFEKYPNNAVQFGSLEAATVVCSDGVFDKYGSYSKDAIKKIHDKIKEILPELKKLNFDIPYDAVEEYLAKIIS